MIRVESPRDRVNVAKVYEAGQEQIFEHWDELASEERRALLAQIETIDFVELGRLTRGLVAGNGSREATRLDELSPPDWIELPTDPTDGVWREAVGVGEESLAAGQVAVFLVAGGQGTRLGFDEPKGFFPAAPVSGKTLFQTHAEKILGLQRRFRRPIGRSFPAGRPS